MGISFKDYIESHKGGFQVFCKNKAEDIALIETLLGFADYVDDRDISKFLVGVDEDDYPRQQFFLPRFDMDTGAVYYILDGYARRKDFSNLYDTDTCPPFRFEEVMNYYGYGDTSDCAPDKRITSADIFELMQD